MKLSSFGALFIHKLEEGSEPALTPYPCQAGVLTIGWGHTSAAGEPKVVEGMQITREDADAIFANDIAKVEDQINEFLNDVGVEVNPRQFDALVSFVFNTGELASTLAGEWISAGKPKTAVAAALCLWNKADGVPCSDVADRRYKEARLFVEGIYGKGIDE